MEWIKKRGQMERRREEEEEGGEHDVMGWSRWGKNREGEQKKKYLD